MIKSHNSLIFRWDGVSRDYIHFQPHKKKKGWVLSPFSSNFKSFLCLMSSWFDWSKMPINSQHEMGKGSKKTWPCASSQLLVLHRATGGTPATLTREAKGTLCFKHSIYFLTDVQNFNLNFRTETANVSAAPVERCMRWPKTFFIIATLSVSLILISSWQSNARDDQNLPKLMIDVVEEMRNYFR